MATKESGTRGQSAQRERAAVTKAPTQDLRELLSDSQCLDLLDLVVNEMDSMELLLHSHSDLRMEADIPRTTTLINFDDVKEDVDQNVQPQRPKKLTRSLTAAAVKTEAESVQFFNSWSNSVLVRLREAIQKKDKTPLQPRRAPRDLMNEEQRVPGKRVAFETSQDTPLRDLPTDSQSLIVNSLLLILLSLKHYNAHSRVLLVKIASALGLPRAEVSDLEINVAHVLLDSVKDMALAEEELKRKAEETKVSRRWKIGLASVAGAAFIGVTGGLAAPLVAAGIGTLMGGLGLGATVVAGYLGAVAGSSVIIGGIFGAYGARMSGRMMGRYAKEVEDFAFLPLGSTPKPSDDTTKTTPTSSENRLRVTIGISGWLAEGADVITPWRVLGKDSDVFALRWELHALLRLGNSLQAFVRSAAWTFAGRAVIAKTAFAPVLGAFMLPIMISRISYIVDNPFNVAKIRADKAGEILADALISKAQGERPVTLIGYSLGARVIFSCLNTLAQRRAFGLVESAILLGAPTPSNAANWRMMRTVVSGRLINVYSTNDSILRFLYRANSAQRDIAGLEAIPDVKGVEAYDVTDLVSGHLQYPYLIGKILERVGLDHLNQHEIERQSQRFEMNEAEIKHLEEERLATSRVAPSKVASAGVGAGASAATGSHRGGVGAVDTADTDPSPIEMYDHETEGDASEDQAEPSDPAMDAEQIEREIEAITNERLMAARMGGIQLEDNDS